jgi:hypothetical protein
MTVSLDQTLHAIGYPGICLLLDLSRAVPLVPAETVVPLAGLAAANGRLGLTLVVISAGLGRPPASSFGTRRAGGSGASACSTCCAALAAG